MAARKRYRLSVKSPLDITEWGNINDNGNCDTGSSSNPCGDDSISSTSTKPRIAYITFFCFLPPVKRYHRAMEASRTLSIIRNFDQSEYQKTKAMTGYGRITTQDLGFQELMVVLSKQKHLKGVQIKQVEELRLNTTEHQMSSEKKVEIWSLLYGRPPEGQPQLPQILEWISIIVDGKEVHLATYWGSLAYPQLIQEIRHNLKKELANYVVVFTILWLLLNTFLIFYVNLFR